MNRKRLIHYSKKKGLKTLSPYFMGTGAPSEELRHGPVQTKQTSYYMEGVEPESIVRSGAASKYTVDLEPHHKLYDIYEDPAGHVARSVKESGKIDTDHIRGTLKDAGYTGLYTTHPDYSKHGIVNIFHDMPVSGEEELGKEEGLQKSPYGPKGAGLYSANDNARRKMDRTSEDIGWGPNRAVHSTKPTASQQAEFQAKEYKLKSKKNPVKVYTPEEIKQFEQSRMAASELEKGFKSQWGGELPETDNSHVDRNEWWHGSPSGKFPLKGIHVGSKKAAHEALTARIGHPVDGEWDGTRKYGETLLAGKKTLRERGIWPTGYSAGAPEEDHYPTGKATYSDGSPILHTDTPTMLSFKIKGRMTSNPQQPRTDRSANASVRANMKNGIYYVNEGEDVGSISAVVPSYDTHLELIKKSKELEKGAKGDWQKEGYRLEHWQDKNGFHNVAAMSPDNRQVGYASFTYDWIPNEQETGLVAGNLRGWDVYVHPDHQRKGIASAMYKLAEQKSGKKVMQGGTTDEGTALWNQPNRPFGKNDLLSQTLTRGHARSSLMMSQKDTPKSNLQGKGNISSQNLNKSSNYGKMNTVTEEDLMKGKLLRDSLIGNAMLVGLSINDSIPAKAPVSISAPAQCRAERVIDQKNAPNFKEKMLRTVASVESNSGSNYGHKKVDSGLNAGQTAAGSYGLMPITVKEVVQNTPHLNKKYGHLLNMNPDQVKGELERSPGMQHEIAGAHMDRLTKIFGNNPATIGYAWLSGIEGTKKAIRSGKNINDHWHTKKILKEFNKK